MITNNFIRSFTRKVSLFATNYGEKVEILEQRVKRLEQILEFFTKVTVCGKCKINMYSVYDMRASDKYGVCQRGELFCEYCEEYVTFCRDCWENDYLKCGECGDPFKHCTGCSNYIDFSTISGKCYMCDNGVCTNCDYLTDCEYCNNIMCDEHIVRCNVCNNIMCNECHEDNKKWCDCNNKKK